MKKYLMFNDLINFSLYVDDENYIKGLQDNLENYINFQDWDNVEHSSRGEKEVDLTIVLVSNLNELYGEQTIKIDNHLCSIFNKKIYILLEPNNNNDIFLKRMLSDLVNRFIEIKGGIFLHSSSVVDINKSIVFIGNKGSGKTTNMLYLLNQGGLKYSSNERTAIIKLQNKIVTYGNPSRINIRADSLANNDLLRKKLWDAIDQKKYAEYKEMPLSRDCSERLVITYSDICRCLNVNCIPTSELGAICNLIYSPSDSFRMEEMEYKEFIDDVYESSIDGVFEQREILNSIFPASDPKSFLFLGNEDIRFYNVYQNNSSDNSAKIIKRLKRDLRSQKCLIKY